MRKLHVSLALAVFGIGLAAALGQFISNEPQHRSTKKPEDVEYLFPEQITLPAGKPSAVALHFRVAPGLHVNSHSPSAAYLIPTSFSIPKDAGARLAGASYPAGSDITLPADPSTKLNVYTGEFVIDARLVASPGDHLVRANLHYQACDQMECMPPKTITVPIDVIGK